MDKKSLNDFFQEGKHYDIDHCFLCDVILDSNNTSLEHVIPRWLQRKHNLPDKTITLLNKSLIQYSKLVIPCCKNCNTIYLSSIENRIRIAFQSGAKCLETIDKRDLFLWLAKIFYGILYKELFLQLDRSSNQNVTITDTKLLESYQTHLLFLQASIRRVEFANFFPCSLFVFETQPTGDSETDWDLMDNLEIMTIGIRSSSVGVIAVLQDCETIKRDWGRNISRLSKYPLHPCQFAEIFAYITYAAKLINRIPKFISFSDGGQTKIVHLPLAGLSKKTLYDSWNNAEYAMFLSAYLHLPLENVYNPECNGVFTALVDQMGNPMYLDVTEDFE